MSASSLIMTSKERFDCACAHRAPDRPPIDYLAHYETDRALRAHLDVTSEVDLLDALESDFYYLPGRDLSQREGILKFYKHTDRLEMTETERVCPLGIRWRRGVYDAKFSVDSAIRGPFEDTVDAQDILRFPWPKAADFDFDAMREDAERHRNRIRIGGFWTGILGDVFRMHGFQNFLMNMAAEPEFMHALIDRMTDMYLELNDAVFRALKGELEVWFFGNDFGTQQSLLLSPAMWEAYYFDNICRLTSLAKAHGLKVMMHSCGAIRPLIPRLIDAGVELLDPVQVSATSMVPAELKAEFGDRIVFHGGIDTQHILPFGSTDEVRAHVRETIDVLGAAGGYLCAPSQILGSDIPVENILVMYEEARRLV